MRAMRCDRRPRAHRGRTDVGVDEDDRVGAGRRRALGAGPRLAGPARGQRRRQRPRGRRRPAPRPTVASVEWSSTTTTSTPAGIDASSAAIAPDSSRAGTTTDTPSEALRPRLPRRRRAAGTDHSSQQPIGERAPGRASMSIHVIGCARPSGLHHLTDRSSMVGRRGDESENDQAGAAAGVRRGHRGRARHPPHAAADLAARPRPRQHLRPVRRPRGRGGRPGPAGQGVVERPGRPAAAGRLLGQGRPHRHRDPQPPRPLRWRRDPAPRGRRRRAHPRVVPHLARPRRGRRRRPRTTPRRRRATRRTDDGPSTTSRRPWDRRAALGRRHVQAADASGASAFKTMRVLGRRWMRAPEPNRRVVARRRRHLRPPRVGRRPHAGPHRATTSASTRRPTASFLSGDHVLPTITPHISGLIAGADPLAQFFASLDRIAALEGVTLALPGPRPPVRRPGRPVPRDQGAPRRPARHAPRRGRRRWARPASSTCPMSCSSPARGAAWPSPRPTPTSSTSAMPAR